MPAETDVIAQRRAQLAATLVARLQADSSVEAPESSQQTPRERFMLFAGPLVRAILEGRKRVTRRLVQPQTLPRHKPAGPCPFGVPGDRLWVREKWGFEAQFFNPRAKPNPPFVYAADGPLSGTKRQAWRPSLHMPRAACRAVLHVTATRAQRLTDITKADAIDEGCPVNRRNDPIAWFRETWDRFYAARHAGWRDNPWVWVLRFELDAEYLEPYKPRAEAESDAPDLFA
jgi:hypothetical protein